MTLPTLSKKLVIVGDGAVGKVYVKEFNLDGQMRVNVALWDTVSQCDYDRLRPLTYFGSDVILIAFAVDSRDSLDNVMEKWFEEVKHWCPDAPIFLVANKFDLRHDPQTMNALSAQGMEPIAAEEGMSVAQKIGAKHYAETSAKNGNGVEDLFYRAAQAATRHKRRKKKSYSCTVV